MKSILKFACAAGLLTWASAGGAAEFCSNQITGTLSFNNLNPAVLSLLDEPGDEGMTNLFVYANSEPAGRSATSPMQTADANTSAGFAVTVDVDCADPDPAGLVYQVAPVAILGHGRQSYYFRPGTSAPVVAGMVTPPVDLAECLGVIQFRFVTAEGVPIGVNDGTAFAYRASDSSYGAVLSSVAAGSTEQRLYVEGGQEHRIDLKLFFGADPYTDRQVHFVSSNLTVECDAILEVEIAIPAFDTYGQIIGTVDVRREFEWTVDGNDTLDYPDDTSVIASLGPFQNERWNAVPGDNLLLPSSGAFHLINLVPSTADPASPGYTVGAQMLFRSGRGVQHLQTPALGWGSNAAVVVAAGDTVDLGNLFEIDPGYVRGGLMLRGPAELPGRSSLWRGLLHAGDDDADADGVPDVAGTYGVYWSSIAYEGVDRRATGAAYTAAHGYGYGDFDGEVEPAGDVYRGRYELALGGLQGERSLWRSSFLTLSLSSGLVTSDDEYFYNAYSIYDRRGLELEVTPGEPVTNDLAYCFSEVIVGFQSAAGTLYAPQIVAHGSFAGADFLGQPVDYAISSAQAFGTPIYQDQAASRGQVVMLLPQGAYTLYPAVVPGDAREGITGLAPIELTVGCGQRILLDPCLQMNLVLPSCHGASEVALAGTVGTGCENSVVEIAYVLNGGAPVILCQDCGPNPAVAFTVNLAPGAGENTLTVTATDDQGRVASVSGTVRPDVLPPVIVCPDDAVVGATRPCGVVVEYAPAATDNCDLAPVLVCTPSSGSLFPPGETIVACTATDAAGNLAQCFFTVTASGGPEFPTPAISAVSPGDIDLAGGTPVTVTGTGLTADDEVLLDGVPLLDPVLVSATEMRGQAPALPAGTHEVQLRRCGQMVASLAGACAGGSLPRLFAFDPRPAFARGGNSVTIRGTNFLPTTQIRLGFSAANGTDNLLLNVVVSADGTTLVGEVPPLPVTELLGPRDVIAEDSRGMDVLAAGMVYLPNPLETDPQAVSLRALQAASTVPVELGWRNGFPGAVLARVRAGGSSPEERARAFVRSFKDLLRVQNPETELGLKRVTREGLDDVRLVQNYRGVPVHGGEIVVTLHGEEVVALTGNLLPLGALEQRAFDVVPQLTSEQAIELARVDQNIQRPVEELEAAVQLVIYDERLFTDGPLAPHLGWKVKMSYSAHEIVVDAHSGAIVARLARERTHDFDLDIQDAEGEANAKDDNCFYTSDDVDIADEDDFNSDYDGDLDAVLANRFARDCWHYFHHHFHWGGHDNDGGQLEVFIHTTISPTKVAAWSRSCETMQFADGAVDFEILVHEYTHGIIASSSELEYKYQSGALDEHYADAMGVIADRERGEIDVEAPGQGRPINWTIGENLRMTQRKADGSLLVTAPVRSFDNPSVAPYFDPSHWTNRCCLTVPDPNEGNDYGGVHSNSGIPNKGSHLMIEGGSYGGFLVNGIGVEKVRLIKFSAMRNLASSADFAAARAREIVSAEYFVSEGQGGVIRTDICSIRNGWAAVGIGLGDSDCDGVPDTFNDIDGDFVPNRIDNCPTTFNPGQENPDGDPQGSHCDNCPGKYNPGQEDLDFDGVGDVCDNDLDGDGCLNERDQHPTSAVARSGSYVSASCNPRSGEVKASEAGIHDLDGLRDCEDLDDDGDGIPDDQDPCPLVRGADPAQCQEFRDCGVTPKDWWLICAFGGCNDYQARFNDVINPDPTRTVIFDQVQVVNQTLYLQPSFGTTVQQASRLLVPQLGLAGFAPAAASRWRVELWTRPTDGQLSRLVAVVGDYNPTSLQLAQIEVGTLLAFTPALAGAPATLGATWLIGADPSVATADVDNDGLPDGWEIQHHLDRGSPADGLLDPDGDGASNLAEFQSGTDPADPSSVFRILRVERTTAAVRVDFVGTPGRRFYLERSVDLSLSNWTLVAELPGRGGMTSLTDLEPTTSAQAYYRLRSVPE